MGVGWPAMNKLEFWGHKISSGWTYQSLLGKSLQRTTFFSVAPLLGPPPHSSSSGGSYPKIHPFFTAVQRMLMKNCQRWSQRSLEQVRLVLTFASGGQFISKWLPTLKNDVESNPGSQFGRIFGGQKQNSSKIILEASFKVKKKKTAWKMWMDEVPGCPPHQKKSHRIIVFSQIFWWWAIFACFFSMFFPCFCWPKDQR